VRPVDRLADIPPDILGIHRSRRTARIFATCWRKSARASGPAVAMKT
jgi:hypothetical protein